MQASFYFTIFTVLTLLMSGCGRKETQDPEKGVSFLLNEHRKATIDRVEYRITLDIPLLKSEPIRGKESVSFRLSNADSSLTMDFSADSAHIVSVRSAGKNISYRFVNEHIVIGTSDLVVGENSFDIEFTAGDLSLNRNADYLYSLFVPDRASTCFPLFDQPDLKAVYTLTLKVPAAWEAVSNGALKSKTTVADTATYQFEKTKPISSYLFAFSAGKFSKITQMAGGRSMTMYFRETDSLKVRRNRDEIFNLHQKSLSWLEKYTAIRYPFGKFDFVLLPSFQYGGMEHPGCIFYNEPAIFLEENAPVNKRMARASVIAHESAHMWFGDLVTMDWFNDVWLKEVFANFMAAKIVHPSFPEINHNLRFLLAHYPNAYETDRSAGTHPILQELGNLKNAGTLYGAIIYMKAPIAMRQLERKIGEGTMQESLRTYLKKYAFKNARWDDLIAIIDNKSRVDVAAWNKIWIKTAGMPVYELGHKSGFQSMLQVRDSSSGRIWPQKLVLATVENQHARKTVLDFVDSGTKQLSIKDNALYFPNADGTGYGFFKMDSASNVYFSDNYNNLKDSLMTDPVFRGSMLVNRWEGLVRNDGTLPADFIRNILRILPKEQNPLLIDYLLGNLQTAWWLFISESQRALIQVNMENVLWDLLEKTNDKGLKTAYFRAFRSLSVSRDGLRKLEGLWSGRLIVKNLAIQEEDKIVLAYELALKGKDEMDFVLRKQLQDVKNPDRKARMQFVIPALSRNVAERDAFFESLKKPENREQEAWVLDALAYLHHPLRAKSAEKYLRPSLDMLQEIQLTGDIFFPQRWLHNTFSGHSSPGAAEIAARFLEENPRYPGYLKNKILQATDMTKQAVLLKK